MTTISFEVEDKNYFLRNLKDGTMSNYELQDLYKYARQYKIVSEDRPIKEGECKCIVCKKIVISGRIFKFKDDPTQGLCFDCY